MTQRRRRRRARRGRFGRRAFLAGAGCAALAGAAVLLGRGSGAAGPGTDRLGVVGAADGRSRAKRRPALG